MRLHNRRRVILVRLVAIFCSTFVAAFLLLNYRFVVKEVQYSIAPGTIQSKDTLGDAIRLLPRAQQAAPKPLPDSAKLVIDKIGVNAPVVFNVGDNTDAIYNQLENGVVHYSVTAKPGMPGTGIILGHSSAYPWYHGNYGAVFALLTKLNTGDRFYVQYSDGRTFAYEVKESLVFNPFNADERLTALENAPGNNLILVSCYPVGTNYLRIAVRAQQIDI